MIPQADTAGQALDRYQEISTCLSGELAVNITRSWGLGVGPISCIADAELETLEHAGEVVRVPAVTEYQGDGDRLCVLTGPKVARRSPEQLLEMVVHVQLFEHGLD